MTETTLDLRGLKCPRPALMTRKALQSVLPGHLLIVECTDPMSAIDIPHMITQSGDVLEAHNRDGNVLRFHIRRVAR
jgi:tRNA 2-thiouridine synthesizing protein A